MKTKCKYIKSLLAVILASLMIISAFAMSGCGRKQVSTSDMAVENISLETDLSELYEEYIQEDSSDVSTSETENNNETADSGEAEISDEYRLPLSEVYAAGTSGGTLNLAQAEGYKIVYYDSACAKLCAIRVQEAIKDAVGIELPISVDTQTAVTDKEILVGKTDREESIAVRSTYTRHNICYDIKVMGTKLVIMAEGYKTLEYAATEFEQYVASKKTFEDSVISGDISAAIDIIGTSMFNRTSGTTLRVYHWNMAAPLLALTPNYANVTNVDNNTYRGEIIADILIQLAPDIITTNEIYYGHASGKLYDAAIAELSDFYNILDIDYYKSAPSSARISDTGYETNQPATGDIPIVGAYKSEEVSIPENILYKNSIGLTVTYSGWRYLTEVNNDIAKSDSNPNARVYFHGYHTAVFKTSAGKSFIVSVGHYGDSKTSNKFAAEHYTALTYAASKAGVTLASTPTVVTGDMYTWNASNKDAGYSYWKNTRSFKDAQVDASTNANNNKTHGTFHDPGVRVTTGVSEDFIWYKNMTGLCFKIPLSTDVDACSDHYPVMADLKF